MKRGVEEGTLRQEGTGHLDSELPPGAKAEEIPALPHPGRRGDSGCPGSLRRTPSEHSSKYFRTQF